MYSAYGRRGGFSAHTRHKERAALRDGTWAPKPFQREVPTLCRAHGWIQLPNNEAPPVLPNILEMLLLKAKGVTCGRHLACFVAPPGDYSLSFSFICTDVPYSCMSRLPQFRRLDVLWETFLRCSPYNRAK